MNFLSVSAYRTATQISYICCVRELMLLGNTVPNATMQSERVQLGKPINEEVYIHE